MKIGIIGCGNMGRALLRGLLSKGYVDRRDIFISDKDRRKIDFARLRFKVNVSSSNSKLVRKCNVIILAVKPQDLDAVARELPVPLKGKLLISICAGISTKKLEDCFGDVPVIRVMPNMPALICQGISAISLGRYAALKDRRVARSIFSCIGEVVLIKEKLMDAVTAISGSGPAYYFYLTQKLLETAKEFGIPEQIAWRLVVQTASGSAALLKQSEQSPQVLRKRVSSKGGTTEAAFKVFQKKGLPKILTSAFKAAARRAKELEKFSG